jgi:hypothetical protein
VCWILIVHNPVWYSLTLDSPQIGNRTSSGSWQTLIFVLERWRWHYIPYTSCTTCCTVSVVHMCTFWWCILQSQRKTQNGVQESLLVSKSPCRAGMRFFRFFNLGAISVSWGEMVPIPSWYTNTIDSPQIILQIQTDPSLLRLCPISGPLMYVWQSVHRRKNPPVWGSARFKGVRFKDCLLNCEFSAISLSCSKRISFGFDISVKIWPARKLKVAKAVDVGGLQHLNLDVRSVDGGC